MVFYKIVKWGLSGRLGKALLADLESIMKPIIAGAIINDIRLWGDRKRLKIAPTAKVINTLFNTSSGSIEIGEYTFTGHNVRLSQGPTMSIPLWWRECSTSRVKAMTSGLAGEYGSGQMRLYWDPVKLVITQLLRPVQLLCLELKSLRLQSPLASLQK